MSKKNDDFFIKKKEWSIVKDRLFECYFKPYVSKILHTKKPLIYVDCFAGKGKFDDGSLGSPLIALKIIQECQNKTKVIPVQVETVFIELNYCKDLEKNLKDYPSARIVLGKYDDNIQNILNGKKNYNVFLYIDPYGIKSLRFGQFEQFAHGDFNTIELLINMNSFGFIREACRIMGTNFEDEKLFKYLTEREQISLEVSNDSIKELNEIAGGDYWQSIIEEKKKII